MFYPLFDSLIIFNSLLFLNTIQVDLAIIIVAKYYLNFLLSDNFATLLF